MSDEPLDTQEWTGDEDATAAAPESSVDPASGASSRLSAGTILGERYRIVSRLGKGGMGEVFRADDLKLGVSVALKFLPADLAADAEMQAQLFDEIKVARKISHPNVCRVYDLAEAEGVYFLSMEYIDGEDLKSLLKRIGRPPWEKALELARQICEGLAAAHEAGVLHRDLKPANLMVDGEGRARITDFGLAALTGSVHGLAVLSGTPAYMAPEQLAGREVSARSDLYALGLVLYELFTGRGTFQASSRAELIACHAKEIPAPPSTGLDGFDPAVERVILRCLEKDPGQRPESIGEVLEALSGETELAEGTQLRTLVITTLAGSSGLVELLGDSTGGEFFREHDRAVRGLVGRYGGREIDKTDGFLLLFERPWDAVRFALTYHRTLAVLADEKRVDVAARVGVHLGDVTLSKSSPAEVARGAGPMELAGPAMPTTASLTSLARGGQTLLTRAVFDLARRGAVEGLDDSEKLRWLAHGGYVVEGTDEPIEVFEVGVEGLAPLEAPEETARISRVVGQDTILGWRPAPGLQIPHRANWVVDKKLGEGAFGEVWLAQHAKTGERRVYKFCYEAERLRSLHREITLFRLLKEELGFRDDIARILDWNLEEAPYFIEFAYTEGGSLVEWAEAQGGLDQVPPADRLEIAAQVATALAAAHSVGVLHKDVKPSNVLIESDGEGGPRAVLTDFGIGMVTDRERLAAKGITVLGLTDMQAEDDSLSSAGTRIYMAPELLAGQASTIQADVYALGVMVYQMVVGDLDRPMAQGWKRHIDDELLRDDIAAFVDGSPQRRPGSAAEVAERLRTLDERRAALEARRRERAEAERTQRRRRAVTLVAAVSSVFLVVVSFLAIQAVRARADAERGRAQAEQLIDFMLTDLHEGLEKIGRLDLLDSVARGSREYLDSLGERDETPQAIYQRGLTLLNIGDVLLHQGDAETALATYRSALALFSDPTREESEGLSWQAGRFESHLRVGGVLAQQEKPAEALETFRQALAEAEGLAEGEPESVDRGFAVARARYALAELERNRGNAEAAIEESRAILALGRRLSAAAGESNWRLSRLLLDTYLLLAKVLRTPVDDLEASLATDQEAARLAEALVAGDPANMIWRERLAAIHWETGYLLWRMRDLPPALEAAQAALKVYGGLEATDPTRVERRVDVARSLRLLGLVHDDSGEPEKALAAYAQSLEIFEQLRAEDPSRLSWLRWGARIHQSIAWTQHRIGDLSGALESYRTAHEMRQRLADAAVEDLDPLNELACNHMLLADVYSDLGERESAREEWLRGLRIIEPVTAASKVLGYLDTHSQILLKMGRDDEARPLVEELLERDYNDADFLDTVRESELAHLLG